MIKRNCAERTLLGALACLLWTTCAAPVFAQTDVAPVNPGGSPGAPSGGPGAPGGPPPGGPGAPGGPGGAPPGMPPLPVLLGIGDFLITIDRPYDAEKLYRGILAHVPNFPPAVQGLRDAKAAEQTTVTFLGHAYNDSHDTQLYTYGGGPTFRTPYGRITLTTGTGMYKNNNDPNNKRNPTTLDPRLVPTAADNFSLRKSTYNLLLEPYYGKYDGLLFLSRVTYDNAPDRTLYDVKLTYSPDPAREHYSITYGRHDSFFQSVNEQFFAPESYFQLVQKIVHDDTALSIEHPLGAKLDTLFAYRHFKYSDGNRRDNFRGALMYRVKPGKGQQMPIFRVGLDAIVNEAKFFTLLYGTPVDFQVLSVAADYVMLTRKLKYGAYASYPIARKNFDPPASFFGQISTNVTGSVELYFKAGILDAPGISLSFRDYVVGINGRF